VTAPRARWPARLLDRVLEHSLLLPAGAVLGLLWANTDPGSYAQLAHALEFAVNDIGMVFFFALAMKEVFEATLPGGALTSVRRAAVPLAAALGGMVVPAALYAAGAAWAGRPELMRGWAIPCATDIAFSYLVARLIFGTSHPALPFLLLLAIADDALGLVILALVYPQGDVHLLRLVLLLGGALGAAAWLRRRRVTSFWPYILLPGTLSWLGLYTGGFHPALALVPVVPWLPHGRHDRGFLMPAAERGRDTLNRFERWWHTPVEVMLFFFGLVNAGVPLTAVGTGTWLVLVAIVAGKPLGIVVATALASGVGLRRPEGLSWAAVLVVGCAAGIGFTVALFFATAAFPAGALLAEAKMGALLSVSAAAVAFLAAALLRPSRPIGAQSRVQS
jgi:NhaA family Na+:H+ antiporter